jgi:hypothetical protein
MDAVERRRYRRYSPAELLGPATAQRIRLGRVAGGDFRVVNLSHGGICLRTRQTLHPGASLPLWLILPLGKASVRVQIKWVHRVDEGEFVAGAEYLESNKGWFGPEEDVVSVVERDGGALVGALDEDCTSFE